MNKRHSSSIADNVGLIKNGNIIESQGNDDLCIRMESSSDSQTNGTSQGSKLSNNFDSVFNHYNHEEQDPSMRPFR